MSILTCVVTHNRLDYSKRCIGSLVRTTRPGDGIVVVDNASTDGTFEWLFRPRTRRTVLRVVANATNLYPGAATNIGWDAGLEMMTPTYLHRSDNDIEYLPGWQEEVEAQFAANPEIALLGILNYHEDGQPVGEGVAEAPRVGGNVVMPRLLFERGLRWDERQWGPGIDEDGPMSDAAKAYGWVARLRRTVANNMSFGRYADYPEYYDRTAAERGFRHPEVTV